MRRLALAFALLTACGDGVEIGDLEPALVDELCSTYVDCGLIDDMALCRSLITDVDIDPSLIAAVEAGKVLYDEDKARECLNGIGGSCDRSSSIEGNSEACDETFKGTVAAGGQCAMDEECISRDCNVPDCPDACCQGTCEGDAPTPRPHVGESCAMNTRCVDSYCDFTSTTCVPYRALGQPCMTSNQCATGGCVSQVCTELPGPGDACGTPTLGANCRDIGDTCSAATMTCVAVGLSGDPCVTSRDCSPLYSCSDAGSCELGPRLGETCSDVADCIDRSYCEETTLRCTAPKPDGETCAGDNQCASDTCDNVTNICVTPPICI